MSTAHADKLDQLANQEPLITKVRNNVSSPDPLTKVSSGGLVDGRYIPSPSLDPRNVELIKGVNTDNVGYIRCAIDALGTIHGGLEKLSDAREKIKSDTSRTDANKILMCATEAEKLMDRSARAFDDARKRLTDGIAAIDKSLSDPLVTKADNSLSAEIRAYCKNLPDDKRAKFVEDAVKAKDVTTLTALLGGKHYLSGLSEVQQQHFTRQYRELTAPEAVVKIDVMRKALDVIERRSGLIFTEIEKALGASFETVKKLRTASSAAEAALLLINAAPQQ